LDEEMGIATGVQISGVVPDQAPLQRVYKPGHPDADAKGFVTMPNVNVVTEMVDMITIQRSYDANVTMLSAVKNMANKALDIGR
ncbi:MAG: flagellar basal body rod protein FlgC, partial [Candidatus Sericytochromatia bacterium]|nr:flagellar basal body rod protein FlgC [Candidatus Tanganyikabacteria bacterium]